MYCVCVCVCVILSCWTGQDENPGRKRRRTSLSLPRSKRMACKKRRSRHLFTPPFQTLMCFTSLFVCLAVCTRLRCAYNFSISSWLYSRVYSDLEHMRCPGCTARGGHSVQQLSSCASALPSPPSFFFCNWVNLVWWKKQISKRKYGGKWKKTREEKYI